jgi:hypothetical protein
VRLFFADSISAAVYSGSSACSRSGTRDTCSGYAGTVSIGILEQILGQLPDLARPREVHQNTALFDTFAKAALCQNSE